jgi:tRNA(Arg) A34 adenosine deaminase TadA
MAICTCDRRRIATGMAVSVAAIVAGYPVIAASPEAVRTFIAEAERMKREAVAKGDQPFGAVVVCGDEIVGYGPSRVVTARDQNAHAERVALWDAQRKLGRKDLADCVIYSTSPPCGACQNALAAAKVGRMFHGPTAVDAGAPKSW